MMIIIIAAGIKYRYQTQVSCIIQRCDKHAIAELVQGYIDGIPNLIL